jgi:hypothetical protein
MIYLKLLKSIARIYIAMGLWGHVVVVEGVCAIQRKKMQPPKEIILAISAR